MRIAYRALNHVLIGCLAVALLAVTPDAGAATRNIEVSTRTVLWNPEDRTEMKTGELHWAGGIEITSTDKDFGGWSGLAVSSDGATLLSVSDEGHWLTAMVLYDERGRLSGIAEPRMAPMLGLDGKPISGSKTLGDAEGLVVDTSDADSLMGRAYVSFERAHRIWRYDLARSGAEAKPEQLLTQRHFGRLNSNGGLEAIELLPPAEEGGRPRILAITEDTLDPRGNIRGFIARGRDIAWFGVKPHSPFKPTDMARLPNGDILLLERRYSMLAGVGMQMRRIAADDIAPGAVLDGDVLVNVGQRYSIDNMEGLAVRADENGDLLIYMISDNNYNPLQRTLLLMFRLPGGAGEAKIGNEVRLPRIPEEGAPRNGEDKSEEAVQAPS
ncbi:MAG: esterase-like activity of phytase family protein [Parvibaculaceae bacterium]|nr:esterase-like activity of phytase family protein [Parvibaculaceae bacterium]